MGYELAIMRCVNCKATFGACPQCVNTIRIDPETGLPPDARWEGRNLVHNPEPDPDAVMRSVAQPVCDNCIMGRNDAASAGNAADDRITLTSEERHHRFHM